MVAADDVALELYHSLRIPEDATLDVTVGLVDGTFHSILTYVPIELAPDHLGHRPSNIFFELFEEMKAEMYDKEHGTWFAVRFSITWDGNYDIDFGYDDYPSICPEHPTDPFTDEQYLADLRKYPRSIENVPERFRSVITETAVK